MAGPMPLLFHGRNNMDVNEMLVFARVVQAGSFTAAAAKLGMPKSTVSRKVSELEERLKSRLLHRTTRKLSLTDAGRTYYDYCARVAAEVEEAERAVSSLQLTPRGLLRVTAPVNVKFLGPIVGDFLKRYPDIRLELLCTGRAVDLVEESFDMAIRAGTLADSTLIARTLGSAPWHLVATPGYLKRHGHPRSPEDLKKYDCLFFGSGRNPFDLRLEHGDISVEVALPARMIVSDMDVLHSVATAGLGVALLPAMLSVNDLRAGRLKRVLPDWNPPSTPVHLVYPSGRHLSPLVKTFADHLQERMTPPPWGLGPARGRRGA
jgi:DNA-binding transcriptional LysR family regulator